jgi:hypothetical protein
MSKLYLKAITSTQFEWVRNPSEATSDSQESAEVTLKLLRGAQMEEEPRKSVQHSLDWIITTDPGSDDKQEFIEEFTG